MSTPNLGPVHTNMCLLITSDFSVYAHRSHVETLKPNIFQSGNFTESSCDIFVWTQQLQAFGLWLIPFVSIATVNFITFLKVILGTGGIHLFGFVDFLF